MIKDDFRIFFDMEFTGLNKLTTAMSLGAVSENDKIFYAEFTDFNTLLVDNWIQDNVVKNFKFNSEGEYFYKEQYGNINAKGNKLFIRQSFLEWLKQFDRNIQFYADCCSYDFILINDILANDALSVPSFISPVCHDINQDIMKFYNITDKEAFNMSREDVVKNELELAQEKHNALYDAIICKKIYEKIVNKNLK